MFVSIANAIYTFACNYIPSPSVPTTDVIWIFVFKFFSCFDSAKSCFAALLEASKLAFLCECFCAGLIDHDSERALKTYCRG